MNDKELFDKHSTIKYGLYGEGYSCLLEANFQLALAERDKYRLCKNCKWQDSCEMFSVQRTIDGLNGCNLFEEKLSVKRRENRL